MKDEIPPYQAIDIIIGAKERCIKPPVKGYYISIADAEGRYKMPNRFVYDEAKLKERVDFAKSVSKHDVSIHKCWIHNESGRNSWTPR